MALESRQINVSELDFDKIKTNLKTYLRGQEQFSDYDFEGSALSVLLDVLAYNTHYNALYQNMAINEVFLDSATKRNSVISSANQLGYLPHSAICAEAVLNMTVSNTTSAETPAFIVLPKYTPFNTTINETTYTFYTTEEVAAPNNGSGVYSFDNLRIVEGTPLSFNQVVSPGARFIIPNANADMSTLQVRVQDSVSSTNFVKFTRSDQLLTVAPEDNVYFVKEIDNQLHEITFGDGIFGKALANGNVVHIEYLVSGLEGPNGARVFVYNGSSLYGGTVTLITTTPAFNGSSVESIESIKFNAPKAYSTQNRAVTMKDYISLIHNYFPEARAVSVWGGETNNPPQYGKVFISIVPQTDRLLTRGEREFVLSSIITPRKMLTVTPEIVDPEYIKIELNVSFYYDPKLTSRTSADLTSLVRQSISNYNDATLTNFESVFKFSQLSRIIDSTEPSITNNITTVKLHREIKPLFNTSAKYTINLNNPIYNSGVPEESIITNGFYCSDTTEICYIDDLPTENSNIGSLRLFYYGAGAEKIIIKNIGTIDYDKGIINISSLYVTSIVELVWSMTIKPQSNDVASTQNQFATIDEVMLKVTPISNDPAKTYKFTSSRN